MEHTYDFDLAVIGSGPGGQKAAIMAAKLGHKVCVIDSKSMVGGVCVNTGTIPSKTLREAVLYLTGMLTNLPNVVLAAIVLAPT